MILKAPTALMHYLIIYSHSTPLDRGARSLDCYQDLTKDLETAGSRPCFINCMISSALFSSAAETRDLGHARSVRVKLLLYTLDSRSDAGRPSSRIRITVLSDAEGNIQNISQIVSRYGGYV